MAAGDLTNEPLPYRLSAYSRLIEPFPALPIDCEPFLPTIQGGIFRAAAKMTTDNPPAIGSFCARGCDRKTAALALDDTAPVLQTKGMDRMPVTEKFLNACGLGERK